MKCGKCGNSTLQKAEIRHTIELDGARFAGKLGGWKCTSCGNTEIPLDTLVRFEHAVARHVAEHGPVNGATMRYMRKSVPLSAAKLAALLHVSPETVSRWETGERAVDRASWLVVRGLLLNPESQSEIAELRDEPPARAVSIEA